MLKDNRKCFNLRQAIPSVRTWGRACFVGEGGDVTFDASPDLLRRQVTLIGSWTFSTIGQGECATFIADRKIDVDSVFTHRWKLEQAKEAHAVFDAQSDRKDVFLMQHSTHAMSGWPGSTNESERL